MHRPKGMPFGGFYVPKNLPKSIPVGVLVYTFWMSSNLPPELPPALQRPLHRRGLALGQLVGRPELIAASGRLSFRVPRWEKSPGRWDGKLEKINSLCVLDTQKWSLVAVKWYFVFFPRSAVDTNSVFVCFEFDFKRFPKSSMLLSCDCLEVLLWFSVVWCMVPGCKPGYMVPGLSWMDSTFLQSPQFLAYN